MQKVSNRASCNFCIFSHDSTPILEFYFKDKYWLIDYTYSCVWKDILWGRND